MFNKRQLFNLFWPALIEQALIVSVGLVSTMMMAGVSPYAVSGVGLVESVNLVVHGVLQAIGLGAAVITAQKLGAENNRGAALSAGQAVSMSLLSSLAISAVTIVLAKPIIHALFDGAEQPVLDSAVVYFIFSGVSYPFLSLFTTLSGIFRSSRDSRTPMLSSGISNIVNIAVAVFTVRILGLGVYGAGLAMLLARISGTAFLALSARRSLPFRLPKISFKFDKKLLGELMRIAVPSGIDQFLFNGGKLIVTIFLKGFGTDSIAANSIVNAAFSIINLPGNAIYAISMTVIGQLYGAGKYFELRKYMFILTGVTMLALLITDAAFYPILPWFIGLYGQSEATSQIAYSVCVFCLVTMPPFWAPSFSLPQMLRATGDVNYTMLVSVISMFIARVAGAYFFGIYLGFGLLGIWMAMVADWIIRGIFFAPRAWFGYWNKDFRKLLKKPQKNDEVQNEQ